ERAEDWRWGSLWERVHAAEGFGLLSAWPVPYPDGWVSLVNEPQTESELQAIRRSVKRGQPYGDLAWVETTAKRLGLEKTLRPLGRPRKAREQAGEKTERTLFE